jgi:signal transduction histidine kinase
LFNTILFLWLGATVLLNADRRTWGIWLAGGGLLLAGFFFVCHSAILGIDFTQLTFSLRFWWYVGLVPAVILPFGWYIIMLWYAGFWDSEKTAVRRRHRRWLIGSLSVLCVGLVAVVIYANPVPTIFSTLPFKFALYNIGGTPLMAGSYAVYLVTCIGLSLDALIRPGPSARVMGELARQRARGWLIVASLFLLIVSLLVIGVWWWAILDVRVDGVYQVTEQVLVWVARFDLIIGSILAVTVVVLGQAIVAYEIFTGKTLPRRGLRRQWNRAILLAVGYGILVSGAVALNLQPIYIILLTTILMTVFFALLSWRSYAERDRYIAHLRPFVASQGLYEQLLTQSHTSPPQMDIAVPFNALCGDVLGAKLAYLIALGPLAPLVGEPLTYPRGAVVSLPSITRLTQRFKSPSTISAALNPDEYGGASWAVPLWGERGLIGIFLLGEKKDRGFYTQEEIEIARASGERLVDTQASAEMSRRLLVLQRQHLVESQVVDQQTRRILHDDVLPQIHTAMLSLSQDGVAGQDQEVMNLLAGVHRQISDLLRDFPKMITPEVARLGVLGALKQSVQNEFARSFDEVLWEIDPQAESKVNSLVPLTAEVLYYASREAIRNAARHGRGGLQLSENGQTEETPSLHLRVAARCLESGVELMVEDNGIGLDTAVDNSQNNDQGNGSGGSGGGLALHSTLMAVVGGTLSTEGVPGDYTRVSLVLPLDWEQNS